MWVLGSAAEGSDPLLCVGSGTSGKVGNASEPRFLTNEHPPGFRLGVVGTQGGDFPPWAPGKPGAPAGGEGTRVAGLLGSPRAST